MLDRGGTIFFVLTAAPGQKVLLHALVAGEVQVVNASADPGPLQVRAGVLVRFGDDLVFYGATGDSGRGLWRVGDPDAGATRLDLRPGEVFPDRLASKLTVFGDSLFFVAIEETSDAIRGEVWKSDGTAAGTLRLSDVSNDDSYRAGNVTVAGDTMFFYAGEADSYKEGLWISDGTVAGTYLVKDLFRRRKYPDR